MAVTIDQLVDTFVKIRTARSALKAKFEEKDSEMEQQMRRIENELLRRASEETLTSFVTPHGTAYRREQQHASIGERDKFYEFLSTADDPFLYYEQRPSLARVKEYMKENDGNAPPGVHIFREFRMGIRKAKTKGQKDDDGSDD